MSDSYDAIYAAVRSRICQANPDEAIRCAVESAGLSHAVERCMNSFDVMVQEYARPSVVYKHVLTKFCLDDVATDFLVEVEDVQEPAVTP